MPTGSIFALLGPNGAGKTTTLKLLMNLVRATRGRATVLGADTRRLGPDQFQRIGYVSENQRLPEWMTPGELFDYCRPFYPAWDEALRGKLESDLGLATRAPLSTLSRGTRMKAALLASLAYRPDLVVLDEPFTGLDPLVRDELVRGLLEVSGERTWTVLISSHDIDDVERLADWVGFMKEGQVQFAEPVAALLARFRLVEVVPNGDTPLQMPPDSRWLLQGTAGRTLRFVDTYHDESDAAIANRRSVSRMRHPDVPAAAARNLRHPRTCHVRGGGEVMKYVFHLVRADLRRFRLLLAMWVLVQIIDTVVTGVRPALAFDPRPMTAISVMGTVLFLTRWLGLFLIVPLIVQTHPLVGSDAFWMTRPIPWRALLASKIILLGTAFVAVPALCEVVLMQACRVPIAEIALVALQTIIFQALWLLFVMALSTMTRDLARFALAAGGVLLTFVLVVSTSLAVMLRNMPDGPQLSVVTGRSVSGPAAAVVTVLLLIVAAVVQLVVQYRTRSVRTSLAAGVAGILVVVLIGQVWPWHEAPLPVPAWARQESAVRLVAESPKGEFRRLESPWNGTESWQLGSVRLGLSGIEPGWLATVTLVDGSVQFDDGTTLATAGNGYQSSLLFESVADSRSRSCCATSLA